MRRSSLGLALLLVSAVLAPIDMQVGGTGFSACLLFAALLGGLWILRLLIVERRVAFHRLPVVVAALLFIVVAILSFIVGQYPWFPTAGAPIKAQAGGLLLFVLSGMLFLLVGHRVRSLAQLRYLTWVFIGAGAAALATMLIPGLDIHVGPLAITSHRSVGSLFFVWIVAMSVGQAFWNRRLPPLVRLALLFVAATALARGLILTFSWASGWLPPLVTLGTLLLLRFPRITLASGFLFATPALLLSANIWSGLMDKESWSWMTRVEALKVMLQVTARSPWLGLGPANYNFYTPYFPLLGYKAQFNSHNNYIDLLAQTGIVGLCVFGWFAWEATRLAFRLFARLPDGFGRGYAAGVLGGLAGSLLAGLLADWIVPFVYNIGLIGFRSSLLFWFMLGGLLAVARSDVQASVPVSPSVDRRRPHVVPTRA